MLLCRRTVAFLLTNCPIFSGWFALVNLKLRRHAAVSATTIFSRNANRNTCKANFWLIIQPAYKTMSLSAGERKKSVMHSIYAHWRQNFKTEHLWFARLEGSYCTLIILQQRSTKARCLCLKFDLVWQILPFIYEKDKGYIWYTRLCSSSNTVTHNQQKP